MSEPLTPGQSALFDKASRMIDGAQPRHRACLECWRSLMNAHVRRQPITFSVLGASMGLQARFERRFGAFASMQNPVACVDRN